MNEALGYCVERGYRIYEADVRVALAWHWLGMSGVEVSGVRGESLAKARAEAERALEMSEGMGYYLEAVDAREVLEAIEH